MKANETFSKLEKALGNPSHYFVKPEKGFRKREEWQDIWGCKDTKAKKLIRKHVDNGRMEVKIFKTIGTDGRPQSTPFYRAIK